jgi:uncharacterized YccA/Bax inhibitor family protein
MKKQRNKEKRAKNPVFRHEGLYERSDTPVTKSGVITKTLLMLAIVAIVAVLSGSMFSAKLEAGDAGNIGVMALVALFATLAVAILIGFKPNLAKPLSFVYAGLEGFLLGIISVFAMRFDGGSVVSTALFITIAIVMATNVLYTTGIIKVNKKFVSIVFMMTLGAMFFYLILIVGSLFGLNTSFMFDGSPLAIGISVLMLLIASLNLFVDYFMVDSFIEQGTDRSYEWYLAFGLTVTIVWIYIEALRLVQNLLGND